MIALAVALAGSAGAVARFVVDAEVRAWLARRHPASRWTRLPAGTVVINVTGSFLLGLVTGFVLFGGATPTWAKVVGSGFCGGYTTFSTASVETLRLLQERRWRAAAANAAGTAVLSVAAAARGLATAAAR
ncbi:MAG: CrcB family protein [Kineosporiaceae bacterium]